MNMKEYRVDIRYQKLTELPESIYKNELIKYLECQFNLITEVNTNRLTSKAFVTVDVSSNELQSIDLMFWAELDRLQVLNLSKNSMKGQLNIATMNGIPFEPFQQLAILNLSENKLTGALPNFIFILPNLEQIWLGKNQFDGTLPDISPKSKLTHISLSNNNISGKIPISWCVCASLKYICLKYNKLGPKLPDFSFWWNLGYFSLSVNAIVDVVPNSILNCEKLEYFFADGNDVTDDYKHLSKLPLLMTYSLKYQIGNVTKHKDLNNSDLIEFKKERSKTSLSSLPSTHSNTLESNKIHVKPLSDSIKLMVRKASESSIN